MAQSVNRQIKRGRIKIVWNKLFNRPDFYKVSSKGRYIACNPRTGNFIAQGPGYSRKQIMHLQKQ